MQSTRLVFAVKIITVIIISCFKVILSQSMNGDCTIGGSNPDFNTFQDAANALKWNGVSGPVTFNIRPGIYMKDARTARKIILLK